LKWFLVHIADVGSIGCLYWPSQVPSAGLQAESLVVLRVLFVPLLIGFPFPELQGSLKPFPFSSRLARGRLGGYLRDRVAA